jgi:hypothetical protein
MHAIQQCVRRAFLAGQVVVRWLSVFPGLRREELHLAQPANPDGATHHLSSIIYHLSSIIYHLSSIIYHLSSTVIDWAAY